MDILFRSKKLQKQCCDPRQATKAFGVERAKRLGVRLDDLDAVPDFAAARLLPGRLHELKGDRAGQYSMDLDGPYRLILEPVPGNPAAGPDGAGVTCVRILGIEDTHA